MPNDGGDASEHEKLLSAVFTAVVALAEKLTGERLLIYVETPKGERRFRPGRIQWRRDLPIEEAAPLAARNMERIAMAKSVPESTGT